MIAGLQKMTLLDYPGKVACTVFLQGCNFRCPFCHNSGLLGAAEQPLLPEEELLAFLNKRRGLLDGVCITGGEPTLHPGLPELIRKIRQLGYAVKLDSNGYRPDVLKALVGEGLLDYVAMDIKNCPTRYGETVGIANPDIYAIEESIRFLVEGETDYEFRTTVVEELHTPEDFADMGKWFRKLCPETQPKKIFLQPYADRDSVLKPGLNTPKRGKILSFLEEIKPYVHSAEIRGDVL